MWFWWFMFFCNLLIPVLLIVFGKMMWKHPPQTINSIIGYRTKRSMRNMDTWNFAQEYCGKLWWKIGWIILIPTILIQIPFVRCSEDTIGKVGGIICMVQCIILIGSIYPTEKALKRAFPDEVMNEFNGKTRQDK